MDGAIRRVNLKTISPSPLGPLNVYDSYGNIKGVLMSMSVSEATLRSLGGKWKFYKSSSIRVSQRMKPLHPKSLKYANSVIVPLHDLPHLGLR